MKIYAKFLCSKCKIFSQNNVTNLTRNAKILKKFMQIAIAIICKLLIPIYSKLLTQNYSNYLRKFMKNYLRKFMNISRWFGKYKLWFWNVEEGTEFD